MSNYKRLIDEAMKTASYRLNAGIDKTASATTESSLIKEASELANALEYMSMTSASDGSVVGQARAEMIRDFHKSASAQRLGIKLAGDVGEGPTMAEGVQAQAPEAGKTRLMAKKEQAGNPLVTASPDSTGKTMLESYKQANSGNSLYDILMHNKEARSPVSEEDIRKTKNYATAGNLIPVPIVGGGTLGAAYAAPEGRKMDAALGAFGGGLGGAALGGLSGSAMGAGLGGLAGGHKGALMGGHLLGAAGALGGAIAGQRKGVDYMLRKEAGDVGEYDSEQYMPITGANENSNRRILDDAYVLNGVSKQEAKAPVRDRLREAFAGTTDTLGDQTVKALFPNAYQKGGLKKVASVKDRLKGM